MSAHAAGYTGGIARVRGVRMKQADIQIGKTYCNNGAGWTQRKVLDMGKHIDAKWYGRGEKPKDREIGVEYLQYQGNYRDTISLKTFALWAGSEVYE
jgi:hypothetical protein